MSSTAASSLLNTSGSSVVERIGVIGDVHGQSALLIRALDTLRRSDVDMIACVGDIVGAADGTDTACDLLVQANVVAVRGNHDRWLLEDAHEDPAVRTQVTEASLAFLTNLPSHCLISTLNGSAMLCHGFAGNDLASVPQRFARSFIRRVVRQGTLPEGCRFVICGHSHVRRVQYCEGILVASVGRLNSHASGGCAVIDSHSGSVSFLEY